MLGVALEKINPAIVIVAVLSHDVENYGSRAGSVENVFVIVVIEPEILTVFLFLHRSRGPIDSLHVSTALIFSLLYSQGCV